MIYKDMDKDIIMLRREDGSCIRLCDDSLLRENEKLRELAECFYNWTLINYPENCKEYHDDVKALKELGVNIDY